MSPLGMGTLQNLNRGGSSMAQLSQAAVASQSSPSVVNSSLSSSSNNPFLGTPSNTESPSGMGSLQNLNRSGEEMYRQRTSEMRYSSPIQGVKLVVSNLEESVTDEDLTELFGDIGNVRKVSMNGRGIAEIVFVKREAAEKAVEMYTHY